jgi:hypothetical protein
LLRLHLAPAFVLSFVLVAAAQPPATLPFDEQELGDALAARLPTLPRSELHIEAVDGVLVVRWHEHVRVVELGEARGSQAARVVAVVVADMTQRDAVPSVPEVGASAPTAPALTGIRSPPISPSDRARVSADGALQIGASAEDSWSFDVGLGATALRRRRLVLGGRVGYWKAPTVRSRATGTPVYFDALTLRPTIGVRLGLLELSGGPVLAPFWVRGGNGHRDILAGANVQLSLWFAVLASLRITTRAQLDMLGNRTLLYSGDDLVVATPRFMFGLALGLAWGWS